MTLSIKDPDVPIDRVKVGGWDKKNFIGTPEAAAANLERLKLLKTLRAKLQGGENDFLTSSGDNTGLDRCLDASDPI